MKVCQGREGDELEGLLEKTRRYYSQPSKSEDALDFIFDVLSGAKNGAYGRKWNATGRYFSSNPTNNYMDDGAFDSSKITIYWQRWLMLFIQFFLSMMTDWTCFSLSSIMPVVEDSFQGMHVSNLVTIFLISNVVSSLCEPAIVARLGLRQGVLLGSGLLLTGSLMRSGLPLLTSLNYTTLKAGTVLVGLSQPYFQNTIAQLAAAWFPPRERTLATAIAFLSPVLGVMFSFLIGTCLVRHSDELDPYLTLLSSLSLLACLLALLIFEGHPPTPPSRSAHEKRRMQQQQKDITGKAAGFGPSSARFVAQIADIFRVPGFVQSMLAFVTCDCILNVIITFMSSIISPLGYNQMIVGVIGASYQMAIVIGSLSVGLWVDRTKEHHKGTMLCFVVSVSCLLSLAIDNQRNDAWLMIPAVMVLGLAIGPIQPCSADLSVEVSYPADENTVFTILQLVGNSAAAASVPLFRLCRNREANSYMSSLYYLVGLGAVGLAAMATFSAPLVRMGMDLKKDEQHHAVIDDSTLHDDEDDDDEEEDDEEEAAAVWKEKGRGTPMGPRRSEDRRGDKTADGEAGGEEEEAERQRAARSRTP